MVKGRFQELLLHPVFISLILWGIIMFFIPPLFSKYRIKHLSDEFTPVNVSYYYFDLDSDNKSEEISIDLNDAEQTKIIVSKDNKILDQYDIKHQPLSGNSVYFNDYNFDGYQEIYVFTMNQDSIFLNIIDPVN
ncbi:MAG: hypothetical protein WAL29_01575, partial [Bacteroidales bacterium]